MPVVFGSSDDTASLIGMILSLTWINGPSNTCRNHCRQTQSTMPSADSQIPTEALSCKKETYVKIVQKCSRILWDWNDRLIENGLFQSGKVFYSQTSPNLTFLLEITDAVSSRLKRETLQRVISVQFKSLRSKRQAQTLQHLETYIRHEWDQFIIPKLQKWITLMPRHLQTVLKRRGDATPW